MVPQNGMVCEDGPSFPITLPYDAANPYLALHDWLVSVKKQYNVQYTIRRGIARTQRKKDQKIILNCFRSGVPRITAKAGGKNAGASFNAGSLTAALTAESSQELKAVPEGHHTGHSGYTAVGCCHSIMVERRLDGVPPHQWVIGSMCSAHTNHRLGSADDVARLSMLPEVRDRVCWLIGQGKKNPEICMDLRERALEVNNGDLSVAANAAWVPTPKVVWNTRQGIKKGSVPKPRTVVEQFTRDLNDLIRVGRGQLPVAPSAVPDTVHDYDGRVGRGGGAENTFDPTVVAPPTWLIAASRPTKKDCAAARRLDTETGRGRIPVRSARSEEEDKAGCAAGPSLLLAARLSVARAQSRVLDLISGKSGKGKGGKGASKKGSQRPPTCVSVSLSSEEPFCLDCILNTRDGRSVTNPPKYIPRSQCTQ
ncbi:hypothetical protein KIPB_000006 [Kipferlia bialata]|uniref:Uncharacterized protein n=1 Tax=Kipferlia bialata TaxID=797122 RepID=A0A9K3GEE1_9EUKA|nr:hypothetical protein KIPB_000006 [Kipferlia bialata]|eukprot:g6.t1